MFLILKVWITCHVPYIKSVDTCHVPYIKSVDNMSCSLY